MNRDRLIELIQDAVDGCSSYWAGLIADHLIAHGVTLAEDNNVLGKTPLTNGDIIRAMTDEELADFICNNTKCENCRFGNWTGCKVRDWLKQPVEEKEKT